MTNTVYYKKKKEKGKKTFSSTIEKSGDERFYKIDLYLWNSNAALMKHFFNLKLKSIKQATIYLTKTC